jgi:alpha-beta hydrolase superfamily lysophospholipase
MAIQGGPFELLGKDGCILRGRHDLAPGGARAHCVIVHGLGEHQARYERLTEWLNHRGVGVTRYDQRGHGKSDGPRGGLHGDDDLSQDLCAVLGMLAGQGVGRPLLLGHSLGGLVVASVLTRQAHLVGAVVLSSPALALWLNPFQRLLLASVPRVVPNLRVDNALKVERISHDPDVVAAYRKDPLVHRKAAARLVAWMVREQAAVLAAARGIQVPMLLMEAEDDQLVNPAGSRAFAAAAPATWLTHRPIGGAWHEIFNEASPWRDHALRNLSEWLDRIV